MPMDAPSSSINITREPVFSRAYLQGIPEERKQALFTSIIKSFHDSLIINAASGKNHYIFSGATLEAFRNRTDPWTNATSPRFTNSELIARIEKNYPNCTVYEQEKNIVIDWS